MIPCIVATDYIQPLPSAPTDAVIITEPSGPYAEGSVNLQNKNAHLEKAEKNVTCTFI